MKRSKFGRTVKVPFYLFVHFLITCCDGSSFTTADNKCKQDLFLKPYVTLRKTKEGPEYFKLEQQGLLHLQGATPAYICVNGAAILYHDVSVVKEKEPTKPHNSTQGHLVKVAPGETVRYSNGTFQMFSHKCWYVNRLPKHEVGVTISAHQREKKSKTIASPMAQGIKVTGIFLLASKEPYNPTGPPMTIMLNRKSLGYKLGAGEGIIKDASFFAAGKGPYCLSVKGGSTVVISSKAESDTQLCQWSNPSDTDEKYRKLFKRRYPQSDYKWEACPTDGGQNADMGADNKTKALENQLKPFAMNHVKGNGGLSKEKPVVPSHGAHKGPQISSEETGPIDDVAIKYSIQLSDCVSPPQFNQDDTLCQFISNPDSLTCEKLSAALELEDKESTTKTGGTTGKRDANAVDPPKSGSRLEDNDRLKWKQDLLSLVASIFSKICLPIGKHSVSQLMRVIGRYIARAHANKPEVFNAQHGYKSSIWDILTASLQRCDESKSTRPLEWEWSDKDTDTTKRVKRESSLEPNLKSLLLDQLVPVPEDEVDDDDESKLIIQRSPSVFDFGTESGQPSSAVIYGNIPRWRRQSDLDKLPLPSILEYAPPASTWTSVAAHKKFILHPKPHHLRIKDKKEKEIFYYTDVAQYRLELSPVIDTFWKILTTVLGYCTRFQAASTNLIMYPLALLNFDTYFLDLLKDSWTLANGTDLEEDLILGEFSDSDRSMWLDTCLETSYITSNSLRFRTPRPIMLEKDTSSEPGGGHEEDAKLRANSFVELPQDDADGNKYFWPRKL